MTISSQIRKAGPYAGNGVAASFAFTFKVFAAEDVRVLRTDGQGLEVVLLLGTDYSVTLNPDQNAAPGGQVVLPAALAVGLKLTVIGSLPISQPLNLSNSGGFYPKTINEAFDRQAIHAQQNAEQIARALKFQASDDAASVGELPQKAQRAGRVLAFEASTGKPIAGPTMADIGEVGASVAAAQAAAAAAAIAQENAEEALLFAQAQATQAGSSATAAAASAAQAEAAMDGKKNIKTRLTTLAQLNTVAIVDGETYDYVGLDALGNPAEFTVTVSVDGAGDVIQYFNGAPRGVTASRKRISGVWGAPVYGASKVRVLPAVTTASKTFTPLDDETLTLFTATGAKTASFNSSANFAQNQVFKIGNRGASGDVTITTTGITLTGSATIPPSGTVDVKMTSATTADVISYGGGGITEAPIDGKQYARKDGAWVEVAAGGGDPDFVNTALLCHFDGAQGGVVFTDSSPANKTLSATGTIFTDQTESKFGGASLKCGSGQLSAPSIALGADDFTVEFWIKIPSLPVSQVGVVGNSSGGWWCALGSAGNVSFSTSSGQFINLSGQELTPGAWYHIAFSRRAKILSGFVNGVMNSDIPTSTQNLTATTVHIGSYSTNAGDRANCWLDDLRITPGIARYSKSFTIPNKPFPNAAP